jgi:hypothetical protein
LEYDRFKEVSSEVHAGRERCGIGGQRVRGAVDESDSHDREKSNK